MTRAAYARYKGWDRAYVTRLAQAGRLVLTEDQKLVRVPESDKLILDTSDPSKDGVRERFADQRGVVAATELALTPIVPPAAPVAPAGASAVEPDGTMLEARRELVTEQAARAKLQRMELEGRLVDRDAVHRAVFEKARVARNALFSLADRLATPLAAETSPAKTYDLLVTEIRRVCDELADGESEATRQ